MRNHTGWRNKSVDKMREKHVQEMERLKAAIEKTKSPKLKRDYTKALNEMKMELKDYDRFKANTQK